MCIRNLKRWLVWKDLINILDENRKIIPGSIGEFQRWKQYLQKLFKVEWRQETIEDTDREMSLSITKEEVMHAVNLAKCSKAPGPDEIVAEIIKLSTREHVIY